MPIDSESTTEELKLTIALSGAGNWLYKVNLIQKNWS